MTEPTAAEPTPTHVLIVEDDVAIATALALNLKLEGYRTTTACDGVEATAAIDETRPDLIVLDINLPRKDGLQLLGELRQRGDHTPVIVLSARQDEYDKVAALRMGADDYVTKPFALAELIARLDAVLRRARTHASSAVVATAASPPDDAVHAFGDVRLDLGTRSVTRAGVDVKLTHLELELLSFFVRHPARVFPRNRLLREVWGLSHGGSARTVDNFVAQLRAKLEQDPEKPKYFITIRGSGYRFDP
jgi:DNA-binding response OmpR family regulator